VSLLLVVLHHCARGATSSYRVILSNSANPPFTRVVNRRIFDSLPGGGEGEILGMLLALDTFVDTNCLQGRHAMDKPFLADITRGQERRG